MVNTTFSFLNFSKPQCKANSPFHVSNAREVKVADAEQVEPAIHAENVKQNAMAGSRPALNAVAWV